MAYSAGVAARGGMAGNDEETLGNDFPCLVVGDIAHESAW